MSSYPEKRYITFANGMYITADASGNLGLFTATGTELYIFDTIGTLTGQSVVFTNAGKLSKYNNLSTAGIGVAAIYASSRSLAQTGAVASVATFTPSADGSFIISANVLVTISTTYNFTVTCNFTDEGGTVRTLTMPFFLLAGTLTTAITNTSGPYVGIPVQIRAKASTAITIATTGTFTTVTYNVEGLIMQVA
jgi:hypothetical protein